MDYACLFGRLSDPQMDVSPSTIWKGAWHEGTYNEASPFETSRLTMVMKPGRTLNPTSVRRLLVNLNQRR